MSALLSSPRALRRAATVLAAVLLASAAQAQTATVTGVVTDASTAETLLGASVAVTGTSRGAATGLDGRYTFDIEPGTYTLRASFAGYVPQETRVTVAAGQTLTQNFALAQDLTGLEEVVVTGALSSRSLSRSEVAVSRIDAAALTEVVPYTDISQLLSGKSAGVSVQPSSGNVGGGVRFNIRSQGGLNGQGQPLIFIDGIRIDDRQLGGADTGGQEVGALSDLNPNDIASVEILKGAAAAALYGTNASNGVVLITTKRGSLAAAGAPVPFSLTYQGVTGANTQQTEYTEATAGFTVREANDIFQRGGIAQHTLSASGGSQSVRYFAQYDQRDEDGIVFGNFQQRRTLRGNFEAFPLPTLTLGVNTSYTFNNVGSPQNDNNVLGYLGNVLLLPTPYAFTDSAAVRAVQTDFRTNRFLGSVNASYRPITGLALSGTLGIDASDGRQDQTFPANFVYSGINRGQRESFNRESDQISFQVDARYDYAPTTDLALTSAVGVQGFDSRTRTLSTRIQNFATELIPNIGSGFNFQAAAETFVNERQLGLLAEQSASFRDTYFGSVGLRNDYVSSVGVELPSALYPFARGAVRLDRFGGVPSAFSILKVRAAYGQSGQLPAPTDPIARLYRSQVGGDGGGAVLNNIGNPAIEPETISELELGLDAELFGRVSTELTYYRQNAQNSITAVRAAPSSGLTASLIPYNIGSIRGQGLELGINAAAYQSRDVTVDLGVIVNYATNEVQSLGDGGFPSTEQIFDGFSVNVVRPGLPRSAFFVTPVNGARFNEDGTYAGVDIGITDDNLGQFQERIDSGECIDQSGAGPLNTVNDRCFFGTPYPDWNGSFTLNVSLFQDFSFYALADWATGLSVFNNTRLFQTDFGNNVEADNLAQQLGLADPDEGVTPLTPNTDAYRAAADRFARLQGGSLDANFIEKADFLKLREVTVRYNLGRLLSQQPTLGRVRTASLALSGRNLFTSTPYSGVDPEVNFDGGRSLSRGQDFLTLQNARTVFLTLQVGI